MGADPHTPLMADRLFDPGDLARWSGGVWSRAPDRIAGVMNDSRCIRRHNLYVALPGATVDGHAFVEAAFRQGAGGALVRADWTPPPEGATWPLLRVADTRQALMDLGAGYRRALRPFMVGVTGSVGKSTVKEWTAGLLALAAPTAATCGNFNTDIGLPLSLLQMDAQTRQGVFELGMSHPGELRPLCQVLAPDAAVISTIGPVHLEFFGTVEAIAEEKAELLRAVPATGFVVLDAGSPWFAFLGARTRARVVTVAVSGDHAADYRAVVLDALDGRFTLAGRAVDRPRTMRSGVPGKHNVLNALLAIAAARNRGVAWDAIEAALPGLPRLAMRWERLVWNGITLINDAYNANPVSMEAAIETFAALAKGGRRILILGEMRELGGDAEAYHAACGAGVAASGCEMLIAVGAAGRWLAEAARQAGFRGEVRLAADAREAGASWMACARPGDWVLLKASRGVRLEEALPRGAGAESGTGRNAG